VIIDLQKFIDSEKPYWDELEDILKRFDRKMDVHLDVHEAIRFHYLYERGSSDLARLTTFASERETRTYLESLVARAYSEIHETRERPHRFRPLGWLFGTLPRTFRRHRRAFQISVAVMLLGCLFGVGTLLLDPSSRDVLIPFSNLLQDPSDRVKTEEQTTHDALAGRKARGAQWYIQNNTTVALRTMALGITWGVGTIISLFATGVMLGAIGADYVLAGETEFLMGWLLPHGSFEIPAILIAGQAGLILAGALIGWGQRTGMKARLRAVASDVVTLSFGVAVFLVWAGIVEAFLSQYHKPVVPYFLKISFGTLELVLLVVFLAFSGRKRYGKGAAS